MSEETNKFELEDGTTMESNLDSEATTVLINALAALSAFLLIDDNGLKGSDAARALTAACASITQEGGDELVVLVGAKTMELVNAFQAEREQSEEGAVKH